VLRTPRSGAWAGIFVPPRIEIALNLKNVRADCNFGVALVAHNSNPGMTAIGEM